MSVSMKALGIDKMSYEERCLLVEEIMASLAAEEADFELPDSQRLDLERRIEAYEAGPRTGSSWEDVKARLTGKR